MAHDFTAHVLRYEPTGSRVICNPPPEDTDEDFIAVVTSDSEARSALESLGYTIEGQPEFYTGNDAGGFRSYRKGDVNLITTPDWAFFDRFVQATALARRLNLMDKGDRIAVFQAILYDVSEFNLEQPHDETRDGIPDMTTLRWEDAD